MRGDTEAKLFAAGFIFTVLTSIAATIALVWVAIHFIAKFW